MGKPGARFAALAFALSSAGGCGEAPPAAGVEVVDSAGVEVVTNPPGSIEAAETWSLAPTPVVDIGSGSNPRPALFQVAAVAPLGGDRVAVGLNRPPRVLVVGTDGAVEAVLGGPGDGPGEFHQVGSVVPLGPDSLAVWDPLRRRISVLSPDGRFLREVDLADLAPPTPMGAPSMDVEAGWTRLLPSAPGSVVLFNVGVFTSEERPRPSLGRPEAPSWRISTTGERLATYGPLPGYESYVSPTFGFLPYPFGADTWAAAAGEDLVVGTAGTAEVRVYGPDGELERVVRWPEADRTVAGPRLERWEDFLRSRLAEMPEGEGAVMRGLFEEIPRPERFPAYAGIISGENGEVWIGEYPGQLGIPGMMEERLRTPARRWLVLDAGGRLTARVRTPEGFEPHAVRGDRVWGVFTDTLDVESVRAYAIEGG